MTPGQERQAGPGPEPGAERPTTAPRDELLTLEELADLTRTSVDALYQVRRRGGGPPALRVGRRLLFRRGDVDSWLGALVEPRK